jgi:hypothetical protein
MRKIIYEDVIMDQIESHFRNRDWWREVYEWFGGI